MPKDSGKDKGSISQKADDQQVRISQVSNVSKAVSEMGRKTTQQMQETERKIAEGGEAKEIAGSMNGVLASLKNTIDSLERGVNTATLGTAKAAQDAIKQYGEAISEDFKINRSNMVASALATSTPIFGYFASKFFETGVFKKAKDRMSESISNIFKRKSRGGDMPDDFGDFGDDGPNVQAKLSPAQAAAKAKEMQATRKTDSITAMKIANRDRYENYDKTTEEKMLLALTAIQGAVGAQVGKFDQWYSKFLLQHPYFRTTMTVMKAMKSTFGGLWKAVYFFWRPRGGYRRHLSKSKHPFEAMNQNIGALFVQTMPRLDAIMIYTKATAQATRDLSSHITGIKYPMMDASKLGGTWSLAGVTMKILRGIGTGLRKGAEWGTGKLLKKGTQSEIIVSEIINSLGLTAKGLDYLVTGPGRGKDWAMGKLPSAKEKKRLMGGLGETRVPKYYKGMGPRLKPDIIVQGVYDHFLVQKELARDKNFRKLITYTGDSTKFLKQHDEREKRRTAMGFLGGIFSGAKGLLGGLLSAFGGGGGLKGILTGLAMNPLFWKATGIVAALVGTVKLWDWLDNKFKDGGTLGNTLFTSFRNAFPQFDMLSAVTGAIKDGIGRLMKGEPFDFKRIIKESLSDFFKKKFGMGIGQWWKGMFGTDEEKAEALRLKQEHDFGDDRWAIQVKQKRLAEAKGFKEKAGAWWDLVKGAAKSKLGMEMDESQADIMLMRARELANTYGGHYTEYLNMKYEDAVAYGKKLYAAAKEKYGDQISEVTKKAGEIAVVTAMEARALAAEYGGHAREYVDKKMPEAIEYGKKLKEKTLRAADYLKTKASVIGAITAERAQALAEKHGGKPEEWIGLKPEEVVSKIKYFAKAGGKFGAAGITGTWDKVKEMTASPEAQGLKTKATLLGAHAAMWAEDTGIAPMIGSALRKTGEYIELGKGNFIEVYRQGSGKLKEMWETAAPEKKAIMKRELEKLMASGEVTAKELERMGIKLKDATVEAGEGVKNAVMSSAVYSTNNISNSINNTTSGGSGNSNKMMQEKTMDDICMGEVLF